MMKLLLIAEHDNKCLKPSIYHMMTAMAELKGECDILILGFQCDAVIQEAQKLAGIHKILVCDSSEYEHQLAENTAEVISNIAKNYQYLIASASTFGKNLLPRVAGLLDVAMISDVVKIISPDTFLRPIYAGNAFETVQSIDRLKIITLRTTAFPETKLLALQPTLVEHIDQPIKNTLATFINQDLTMTSRPELTNARIVVSGGRGLKSAENFKLLEKLADRLGAAIGASRAAVDAGFAPNDYQVGQTGKVVAPDLYIAIGISGAIQHLAGMKDSKVIVAINNDPDAPIFQVSDYGLVSDLFSVLTELETELQ